MRGKMSCQWKDNVEFFNLNLRKNYWPQFKKTRILRDGHLATLFRSQPTRSLLSNKDAKV